MKYTVQYVSACGNTVTASGTYEDTTPVSAVYVVGSTHLRSTVFNASNNQWIASFDGETTRTGTVVLVP